MEQGLVSGGDKGFGRTHGDADVLPAEALEEYDDDPAGGPGRARLELAARAAYPLIATLSLWADRGSHNNPNADGRRRPGEVIDTILSSRLGIRQLPRAIVDHGDGRPALRAVNDDGPTRLTEDPPQAPTP